MCNIDTDSKPATGGGINISVTCKTSGKPINVSNEYGMFCEDMCDLEEAKGLQCFLGSFIKNISGGRI